MGGLATHGVWRRLILVGILIAAFAGATAPARAGEPVAQTADRDCGDFDNQRQAQNYFLDRGGPRSDPDRLDADSDGRACESLPCPCGAGDRGRAPRPKPRPPRRPDFAARIVRVTDGDTVVVRSGSGRRFRVRLIGIDTPEVFGGLECGARQASASMKRLAPRGRRVRVKGDPTQDRRDSFGRLLAYVTTRGGPQLNIAQVRRGWAKVFVFQGNPFRQTRSFRRAARRSKRARRGVWGRCGGNFHRRVRASASQRPPEPKYLDLTLDHAGGAFLGIGRRGTVRSGTNSLWMSAGEKGVDIEGMVATRCGFAIVSKQNARPTFDGALDTSDRGKRRFGRTTVGFRVRIVGRLAGTAGNTLSSGTITARVTLRTGRRVRRCRAQSPWKVMPLDGPFDYSKPIAAVPGAVYGGIAQTGFRRRLIYAHSPLLIRVARDGRSLRGLFMFNLTCPADRIRTGPELIARTARIKVRPDGRFASVQRFRTRYRDLISRSTIRFSGRFFDDGAKGRFSVVESFRDPRTKRHIETCRSSGANRPTETARTPWQAAALP